MEHRTPAALLVDLPVPQEAKPKKQNHTQKRQHPGRIPIQEHLERLEIILDIPEEKKVCQNTGNALNMIGWEVLERLKSRSGKLIVNV